MSNIRDKIVKDIIIFDDENNPSTSMADIIWPRTIFDAVFDQNDPNQRTLREVLDEMKEEIKNSGIGYIKFPVTSVNGMYDDVVITKHHIGLSRVNNTSDMEKPLSDPQRNAVLGILADYNFNVDLSDIMAHLTDYNNPHKITTDQLNLDGSITNMINNIIGVHDMNNGSHNDIRSSITNLSSQLNITTDNMDQRITNLLGNLTEHITSGTSHQSLFSLKENISNKATTISKVNNYSDAKYPSTKAVVDYVSSVTSDLSGGSNISEYVSYIDTINSELDLPPASAETYQRSYLLRNRGESNYSAIAVCRKNGPNYWWDIKNFTINKYDPTYFVESIDGLSFDPSSLPEPVDAYDKETSDNRYLQAIMITSGDTPGTISFYINNDPESSINDIPVTGLSNLAFKSMVNSSDIANGAITENHLSLACVNNNHIANKSITQEKLAGDIISNGNIISGSIDSRTIKDYAVISSKIADFAVTTNKIAPECIDSFKIKEGGITTYNIANDAVVAEKIQNYSITTDKLDMAAVVNNRLSNMPAYSIKGNLTDEWNTPDDISLSSIIDHFIATASEDQLQSLAAKLKPYMD